jgi:regulator of RNase E activity RraA|tara:strand:+ start:2267 stop:3007 length:741 start_codon:yes stop_codon:yes gene_type:complete
MVIIRETPDHVLDEGVINELKKVNSTAVVDVLARNGYDPRYVYMPNVVTMNPGLRLVARAVTVRFLPARPDNIAEKPGGNESPEFAAFELAGPGDVIVMESMRNKIMSIGGDIKFLRLKQRGIDGLICDGGIRDMHTVQHYGIGLWGYGKTSNLGTRIGTPYSTNDAINVDGVLVNPGDYLIADDDGVVVIPRIVAPLIAPKAIEYDDLEEWIRRRLDKENLTPGKYYPPDDKVMKIYRNSKKSNE